MAFRGSDTLEQRSPSDEFSGVLEESGVSVACTQPFPSLAKEGLGVVRSTTTQICSDVDRTTPCPSFAKEGNLISILPLRIRKFEWNCAGWRAWYTPLSV